MSIATVVKTVVSIFGELNASYEPAITSNTSASFKRTTETLASGANSFTVPTSAKTLIIEASTVALTVKGVTGDTGVAGAAGQTIVLPVVAAATLCITAAGSGTAIFTWC